jgi:hypothetical protein
VKLGTKFTIQCYDDFDEYLLITEIPGSNVIEYKPMKLDEIRKRINMFFRVSKYAIDLRKERQQLDPAA